MSQTTGPLPRSAPIQGPRWGARVADRAPRRAPAKLLICWDDELPRVQAGCAGLDAGFQAGSGMTPVHSSSSTAMRPLVIAIR